MTRAWPVGRFFIGVGGLVAAMSMLWLSLWAIAVPLVRGWSPVAVLSGSMGPHIDTGDVVIAEPPSGETLGPGTVIVFDNPAGTGSVTHRVVAVNPAGDYITKGDANPRIDSTPVPPDTVRGVGRILVPVVGTPVVWVEHSDWANLALAALAAFAALWTSRWALAPRFNPWRYQHIDSLPATKDEIDKALGIWPGEPTPTTTRTQLRRVGAITIVLAGLVSLGIAGTALIRADAAFADTTENLSNSFVADTLAPPTSLTATGTGPITLDWTATTDTYATGHRVYRSTASGGPYTQVAQVTPRTTTSYIDYPAPGTYFYIIRSYYLGWESTNSAEASATAGDLTFYLHNNPTPPTGGTTSQDLLPLDTATPTATTLYNYDTERDAFAGLVVAKGAGLGDTSSTKFQRWMHVPATDLTLSTTARLTISSAMKDFSSGKFATVEAGLYDCTTAGTSCSLLASGATALNPWPATWQEVSIDFGTINHTITAGRALVVKLVVDGSSQDDLWFAYDTTTHQARLEFPGGITAGDVRDDFDSRDFNGDDGTISWNEASWTQLVETDGALSGKVRVENPYWTNCDGAAYCLTIGGESEASINGRGVERSVDLSGATTATLTYTVDMERFWNSGGSVQVQASSDGISWDTLATYSFSASMSPTSESFDLMPNASAQTRLRIVGVGLEGGYVSFSRISINIS